MSRVRGTWGWRDEQLAIERARREENPPPPAGGPPLPPQWATLLAWVRRYRYALIAVTVLLLIVLIIALGRRSPAARRPPPPRSTASPGHTAVVLTRTPWTEAQAQPFTSGLSATLTIATLQPRSGPATLWPAVTTEASPTGGHTLVALGQVRNSQESRLWLAVRLSGGEIGWLPQSSITISGSLTVPPAGRPDCYVVTGSAALPVYRRPVLPDRPDGHEPPAQVAGSVGPGSVLPLRGVLPRYLDGKMGTQWVRVRLPDGTFGWLHGDSTNLTRDIRYLLPPPDAGSAPWAVPLPAGQTLLGAYGEPLGTQQWALRGGTDVRGLAGDRVQAVANGVVIFAGYSVRWAGYYVVVRHNGVWEGWQTAYIGMIGQGRQGFQVHEGQAVKRGQVLGYLAQGRYAQPTRLHFVVQTPDGSPIESQNVLQWP